MAGRISGYPQIAFALGGLAMSAIFAARFFAWYMVNSSRLQNDRSDPFAALYEIWVAARWPLLGIAIFATGWLWAFITGLGILHAARKAEGHREPPRLS
jgi:hypothetical protein